MNDDRQQPTPQQSEGQNEQQGNQEQGSKVDFTPEQQTAIDNMIAEKVAKERQKAEAKAQEAAQKAEQAKQDAIKKALDRAKMTADERAKAEEADRQRAIAQKQADLDQQIRQYQTKSLLLDKGISADMLPLVMGDDDAATSHNLELLDGYVQKKVQEATEKLLKGKQNPTSGNGGAQIAMGDNPWSKQGFNLTKQQQILATNPDQARQMIAQAQPTGFYFGAN